MISCIRVPRIFLPRGDFEQWAVIARDAYPSDEGYWERIAERIGNAPSCLRFLLPDVLAEEDDSARFQQIHDNMYRALEEEQLERFGRGFMFVERRTQAGIRRGIVAAIDLQQLSLTRGESVPVRLLEEPVDYSAYLAARRGAILEFPHTIVLFRDKKDRIFRVLAEEKVELEKVYDFDLPDGGHLTGYFIPEDYALEIAEGLHGKGEPLFVALDGGRELAAAKAHWEALKPSLKEGELKNHPARFALVEFVNLYGEGVRLQPVHRLVRGIERETLCDFVSRKIRCKREGNVLFPSHSADVEGITKLNELLAAYLRANGGEVQYVKDLEQLKALAAEEDCAGIALKALDREDLFPALKGGRSFPANSYCLDDCDKRYCLEGREISYD